jgi:hypothetical protein
MEHGIRGSSKSKSSMMGLLPTLIPPHRMRGGTSLNKRAIRLLLFLTLLGVLVEVKPIWGNVVNWKPGLYMWLVTAGLTGLGTAIGVISPLRPWCRWLLTSGWLMALPSMFLLYFGSSGWYNLTASLIVLQRISVSPEARWRTPLWPLSFFLAMSLLNVGLTPVPAGHSAPVLFGFRYFWLIAAMGIAGIAALTMTWRPEPPGERGHE